MRNKPQFSRTKVKDDRGNKAGRESQFNNGNVRGDEPGTDGKGKLRVLGGTVPWTVK